MHVSRISTLIYRSRMKTYSFQDGKYITLSFVIKFYFHSISHIVMSAMLNVSLCLVLSPHSFY